MTLSAPHSSLKKSSVCSCLVVKSFFCCPSVVFSYSHCTVIQISIPFAARSETERGGSPGRAPPVGYPEADCLIPAEEVTEFSLVQLSEWSAVWNGWSRRFRWIPQVLQTEERILVWTLRKWHVNAKRRWKTWKWHFAQGANCLINFCSLCYELTMEKVYPSLGPHNFPFL
jgi:hypothetical protein